MNSRSTGCLVDAILPLVSVFRLGVLVPAMTVVALCGTIPTYTDEPLLWDRMMPELARQQITPVGPCGVIEHDDAYAEHDVDEEIFLPVAPRRRRAMRWPRQTS